MKLKLNYDRESVGQSVLVSSPWPDFCSLFDNCGFLAVGRPLWREDGYVIYSYNCFWALPEQSLLGQSPAELTVIFYSHLRLPQPGEPVPVCPPRTGWTQLNPRALGSFFVASYDSKCYGEGILTRLHTGLIVYFPFTPVVYLTRHELHRKHRAQQCFHCCTPNVIWYIIVMISRLDTEQWGRVLCTVPWTVVLRWKQQF
jgi:hypothetical protein